MTPFKQAFLVLVVGLGLAAVTAPAQQFLMETFDDNANGWTLGNDWVIGAATVGSSGGGNCNPDPGDDASGVTGGGVAGTNPGGAFAVGAAPGDLFFITSPVIDTSGAQGLVVEYQRWLNADYNFAAGNGFMDNRVEVFNGNCWVRVETYGTNGFGSQPSDTGWQTIRIDVSDHTNANFRVRFGTEIVSAGFFEDCNGWNIDNVRVQGTGVFYERFDDNSAGWLLSGDWQIGPAASGNSDDPDTDGNRNLASGLAGVVIGGTAPGVITSVKPMISPVIDTTGLDSPTLSFDRTLVADYLPFQEHLIEVFDGSAWVQIFEYGSAGTILNASDWTHQVFDLTPYSNASLQIRWTYENFSDSAFDVESWSVDNVCVYDGFVPNGQPSSALASLDVNGIATNDNGSVVSSGQNGPYYACVGANGAMQIDVTGAANQPWVLLVGDLNVGANLVGPFGRIDLGTSGLNGIAVVGTGLEGGFNNSFYVTGDSGEGGVGYFVPVNLIGATFGLQAVMVDPAVQIRITNAVRVEITD